MAQAQRNDQTAVYRSTQVLPESPDTPGSSHAFQPGGQVGQMQAELAARLASSLIDSAATPEPGDRVVRFLSVAGGYGALAAAYAGVAMLFLR